MDWFTNGLDKIFGTIGPLAGKAIDTYGTIQAAEVGASANKEYTAALAKQNETSQKALYIGLAVGGITLVALVWALAGKR